MSSASIIVNKEATQKKYFAIEGRAKSAEEAIKLCGAVLTQAGCTTNDFAAGCIEREKLYPTGICAEVPVAIPHCQSSAILQDALCYLRLKEPVEFKRMDDDEHVIYTRHIFNLAIMGSILIFYQKSFK